MVLIKLSNFTLPLNLGLAVLVPLPPPHCGTVPSLTAIVRFYRIYSCLSY